MAWQAPAADALARESRSLLHRAPVRRGVGVGVRGDSVRCPGSGTSRVRRAPAGRGRLALDRGPEWAERAGARRAASPLSDFASFLYHDSKIFFAFSTKCEILLLCFSLPNLWWAFGGIFLRVWGDFCSSMISLEGDLGFSAGGFGARARGSEETLTARVSPFSPAAHALAATEYCAT